MSKKIKLVPSSLRSSTGGRYFWDGSDGVDLDVWIDKIRPSKLSDEECSWIQVKNCVESSRGYASSADKDPDWTFQGDSYLPALNTITDIIKVGKRVSAKEKKKCVDSLLDVAKEQKLTVGKWMLFVSPEGADKLWERIATATANGKLGCSAKIAPIKGKTVEDGDVVCCIYVRDCTDKEEVKRVLVTLNDDMALDVKCGFKPDFYTYLGIYRQNQWSLEPTLYSVSEVLSWQ